MKKILLLLMLAATGYGTTAQNTSTVKLKKFYYRDLDGDGYGNIAEKLLAVSCPLGYVEDSSDCIDTDTDINSATIWFKDGDVDGFGDRKCFFTGCTSPAGTWVMNNWDADDTKKAAYTEDEMVLICNTRVNKEDLVKWKNVGKKQNEGWLLGPCTSGCQPGLIQMCHNGKLQCVAAEKVEKNLAKGWIKGPCLQPVPVVTSPTAQRPFPVPVADDEKSFVYPNPTNGQVLVRLPKFENGRVEILVIGSNGVVIEKRAKQPGGQTERFDLSKSGAGIYLVKIITAGEEEVFRVVFQRSFIQQ